MRADQMDQTITKLTAFVYGTLKPGGRYWPEFCEGKVGEPVPATVRGQLYDLHVGYPGLLLEGDAWVQGYLLTFKTEKDFLRLDYLEGYDPARTYSENEYIRKNVQAYSTSGEALGLVWAYEITAHVMDRCQGSLIPDGNWPI